MMFLSGFKAAFALYFAALTLAAPQGMPDPGSAIGPCMSC